MRLNLKYNLKAGSLIKLGQLTGPSYERDKLSEPKPDFHPDCSVYNCPFHGLNWHR